MLITSANVCDSDPHMCVGRTDFESGRWFGHENPARVVEVGGGFDKVQVGECVAPDCLRLGEDAEQRARAEADASASTAEDQTI